MSSVLSVLLAHRWWLLLILTQLWATSRWTFLFRGKIRFNFMFISSVLGVLLFIFHRCCLLAAITKEDHILIFVLFMTVNCLYFWYWETSGLWPWIVFYPGLDVCQVEVWSQLVHLAKYCGYYTSLYRGHLLLPN